MIWGSDPLVFGGGLLCASLITPLVRDFAMSRGWIDSPGNGRHIHCHAVPRLGGVAIYLSVVGALGIANILFAVTGTSAPYSFRTIWTLLGSATAVFLLGLYDDLRPVSPYWKIMIQSLAAVFLYMAGFRIYRMDLLGSGHSLSAGLDLLLTVLWVLLITNAFNLIDGLDGLAAGSALLSLAVMFVVALFRNDATVSVMTLVLAGAMCGFLRFNFYPATIFLGDSGSLFIGFVLSAIALAGSQKATTAIAVAIPVVSFGLPVVDVALAVVRRLIRGKHLFAGDTDHIHHRLLKKGFSHREAVILLYVISAGFGLLSLSLLHGEHRIALVLSVVGIGVWSGVRYLRYAEISEVQSLFATLLQRRRILANNLILRQAAEALEASSNFEGICKVVKATLEPLGFAGVCYQLHAKNGNSNGLFVPLRDDGNGGLWHSWGGEKARKAEWELRLELAPLEAHSLGRVSLFRPSCDERICVDSHILSSTFRLALSGAVERALANGSTHAGEKKMAEVARAHRAASA
ncbi:MAG: undecaprenyl/decaprenyl-phosphate alpha-N-acetylglucosaminyl 1-phosphate transferase [Acidobacteriia bacterium]|nr:undecaprenyl/decaprenyl-phosphate alpha-N-acetylglucosaminyl 1-phosphate transferase [Terriglobia bacterium]